MARESITLITRDKREVQGTAEVSRSNSGTRLAKLVGCVVGSVVLAVPTIFIPGVHFVAPWALPLAGLVVGFYFFSQTAKVAAVQAACPDCDTSFDADGGALGSDTLYVRCSGCAIPLEVVVSE